MPLDGAVAAVIDGSGVLTTWTRAAAELLGYADADVIGRPARALVAPRRPGGKPRAGAPGGRVLALRRDDGERVDVWVRLLPLSGSAVLAVGLPAKVLAEWGDHTAVARTVLTQNAWQVAFHGLDLRLLQCSPTVWQSGRVGEGGRDPLCDMPLVDGDGTGADLLRHVMETGRPVVGAAGVLRAPRPDQPDLIYSLTAAPLNDLRGDISGTFTSLVDVTARYESGRRLNLVYKATRAGDALDIRSTAEGLVETLVPTLGDLAAVESPRRPCRAPSRRSASTGCAVTSAVSPPDTPTGPGPPTWSRWARSCRPSPTNRASASWSGVRSSSPTTGGTI